MGHISPLIGIILSLKDKYDFIYFGLEGSMEEEICKKNNITFHAMKLTPFYRKNIFKNFKTILYIIKEKRRIIKIYKNKNIKAVITSGGFVSIPLVLSFKKVNKILLESNTTLGLANKMMVRYVKYLGVQFDSINHPKKVIIGNPIKIYQQSFDHPFFYLNEPLILFVGGSNGALDIILCALEFNKKYPNIKMMVITGERYFDTYKFNQNVKIFKKIDNLNSILNKFTLVISRAGAATICELLLNEVNFILYPSKNVSGNHQCYNAEFLREMGCCKMIEDYSSISIDMIYNMIFDKKEREIELENQKKVCIKDSVERIINLIEK